MANETSSPAAAANETVVIACKLPHGLYLDLLDAGGNLRARHKLTGVAGFTLPNPDRKFQNPNTEFAHTLNIIPKKHWDEWFALHQNHPAILSGAIMVAPKRNDALAMAREHEREAVGFEKVDPKKEGVSKLSDAPKPE